MSSRRSLRVALGSLLVAALVGLLASAASAGGSGPDAVARAVKGPVDASKLSGNESETAVAVNPTDPDNVVIVSNRESGSGLVRSYSTDGGATWTTGVIANGGELGHACCDGTLSWDEFGNLFLGYLSDDNFNVVPVAVSVDGGRTFRLVQNVDPGPNPRRHATAANRRGIEGSGVDQPTLVAGEGMLWVVWNGGSMKASGAAVTGLGQIGAFSAAQVAPGTSGCSFGDVAIGPDQQVMQVCQNPTGGQGPATVYGNVDPDGLGPAGFGAQITITTTNVGGFDFIPAQSGRSVDAEAGLAWDRTGGPRDGRLYLVYTDEIGAESNDTDIFVRVSDDDGQTWTNRVRVNDDATTNSQFNPKISLDDTTGNIAVSFHDCRFDLGDGGNGDTNGVPNDDANFFGTFSTNGGSSFLPNLRLSRGTSNDNQAQNGIDYGDYTGLDFYAGSAHPAWADNSNSTGNNPDGTLNEFDLYTATVRIPR